MREWIVTNGLGGYSSLTYKNTNTRKYHGLLVASLNPPTNRWVFVSNIFDKIRIKDKEYNLNDYKAKFRFDYFPSFSYKIDDVKIKKTFFMEHEKNTTGIRYKITTKKPVTMIHSPLINSRHIYDVNKNRYQNYIINKSNNKLKIKPENVDRTLEIIFKDCFFKKTKYWETLYYEKDHERNDSWIDNNIYIGDFYKTINKTCQYFILLSIEEEKKLHPLKIFYNERDRKKALLEQSNLPKKFEKLILSADNFIVKKEQGKSIIAGYHWFSDWGRDTLIALPGLTLVTKRFEDAKMILLSFAKYCKNGLIPNVFMDRDQEASYNTVDASLWFIDRVYQYYKYTKDLVLVKDIWNVLESIIVFYKKGTDYNIKMDEDFLIMHDPGLTWMDVKIGAYYPTPRDKKAVEIQALWYNALKIMSFFTKKLKIKDLYCDLAVSVKKSFNSQYDNLYDVIDRKDTSIRPNQIMLASLDFAMIDEKCAKKIIQNVENNLLTVFGLRTLNPEDSRYKGSLFGNYNKDEAYHNGTVWPWLLGSFITAYSKINKNDKTKIKYAYDNFLKPMLDVYGENWDGSIHEIFDGSSIYTPRGCITQAWSVAEILRAWVEDIEFKMEN